MARSKCKASSRVLTIVACLIVPKDNVPLDAMLVPYEQVGDGSSIWNELVTSKLSALRVNKRR